MSTTPRRNTRQRQVVLEELSRLRSHPTAAELYEIVRARLPLVSLGTIYRNLDILQETGQAVRLAGTNGTEARFDGRTDPHMHFQCRICNSLRDLDTIMPLLDEYVGATMEGHHIEGYNLILRGICQSCRS